jgi:tetratricopeptide (TPR) repeat protein
VSVRLVTLAGAVLLCAATAVHAATGAELEARSKTFYDLLASGNKARAAEIFPGLERDLEARQTQLEEQLDSMREQVVDADGDVDALYQSSRWRDPEVESFVVAYHLAWVRYQGAQLTDDKAKKKRLLEDAIDGFSKFLVMEEVQDIYAESLYGRGLAYMDAGNYKSAIDDLGEAAGKAQTRTKAQAALAEAKRRAGGQFAPTPPPPPDPEALLTRMAELLPQASGGSAAAEKEATELARGLAAKGGSWPDRVDQTIAQKLGDGTPGGVRSSYGLWLLAQLALDRGRCGSLPALVTAGADVKDAGRERHRPQLLFLEAGCELNAGKQAKAAEVFGLIVEEFPKSEKAREASYYQFRALDLARDADALKTPAFKASLEQYIERWGSATGGDEARYLLGEMKRADGDCEAAAVDLGKITKGAYATRARMAVLECRVGKIGKDTPADERAALVKDLQKFVAEVKPVGDDADMAARAALMGALVANGTRPPDDAATVALLAGFEQKYPGSAQIFPRVVETRLRARLTLNQLAEAEADLDSYLASKDDDGTRAETVKRLGRDLANRAAGSEGDERTLSLRLARKLYQAQVAAGGGPAERIVLAELELDAGDPVAARKLFEEAVAAEPTSVEAMRGAARAATAAEQPDDALAFWRAVLEASEPGGTSWYEARIAQVQLLAKKGQKGTACEIVRSSQGRSKTAGGDELAKHLQTLGQQVCQ